MYVCLTTTMSNRLPNKQNYYGIFIDNETLENQITNIKNEMKEWNEKIHKKKIIKNPLRQFIGTDNKKIFITREIDGSFVWIPIKKNLKEDRLKFYH